MDNYIDLKSLISLILSKWWLILLAALIGGGAAFGYSKLFMPLKYKSELAMYVQSYTSFNENPDHNYNNINNSKQLINTYKKVLKDKAVLNDIGDHLIESFSPEVISKCFTVSNGKISPDSIDPCISLDSPPDTSVLSMTTITKDPEVSAAICNYMALVAPDYIERAVGVGEINAIDTARVSYNPVSPNVKKNAALGAFAAAFLAVVLIILVDFFDNTVKETEWLNEKYKKAIIGEIQQFDLEKKRSKNDKHVKLTDKDVPFSVVESYKSIRTNVNFALSPFEKKVFTISSTSPAEGKSTTSANIAIALAQGGSKVLLIDGDLRKSVQHKIFGVRNRKGLSTAIGKMADLDECIAKDVMENLDIMPAGPIPPNPSELLASDNMTSILEKLSERYSVVIIDTPPVNVVTDSMELAKNVSGTIMVVRYGDTTTDDIDEAMKKIEFSNMNMLGFILNGVKVKHKGKYYSKYKYKYYKYDKGYGYGYEGQPDDDDDEEGDSQVNKGSRKKNTNKGKNKKNKSKKKKGGK